MCFQLIEAPENAIIVSKYLNKKISIMNSLKHAVVLSSFLLNYLTN
jgi:hypothetical protein